MEKRKIDAAKGEDNGAPENSNNSESAFLLGLSGDGWMDLEEFVTSESYGFDLPEVSSEETNVRSLDKFGPSSRGHGLVFPGEGSWLNSFAPMENESCDRNMRNKHAKNYRYFQRNHYTSAGSSSAEDSRLHAVGSYGRPDPPIMSVNNVPPFSPVPMDGSHLNSNLSTEESNVHTSSMYCSFCIHNQYTSAGSSSAEDSCLHAVASYGRPDSPTPSGNNIHQFSPVSMDGFHLNHNLSLEETNVDASMEESEVDMDFSDDLLHLVFSFLGRIDLCRAAMVCKQWRTVSSHENFWRSLNFENHKISARQLEDLCRRYPRATEVTLYCPSIHRLVTRAVSLLRNLESLNLGRGHLGGAFFQAVSNCRKLKCLVVSEAYLGNNYQEISINHNKLQNLQITKCRVGRISVRCARLGTLSLKRSSMAYVVLSCPLLHNLDIGSCHKIRNAAIRSAVTSCSRLESLDMSNCSCVSDETLREIAHSCPNIRVLNASYCPNISLESVRLPMLTHLKLESCEGITSASMAAISHSYMLEDLKLDNCRLLTSVSLHLPQLKNISLMHCRKFIDLNLRCNMLSSVSVWNSAALQRITIISNALKKLMLQKKESLTTLSLQCQHLEELDLSDCESLTNSIWDIYSVGGGCPMLKHLVLDNCESLTEVMLRSTSLVSLSLAGCRAITSFDLACPNIEQVRLVGCDHLERASFCPVGLQSLNLGICPKLSTLRIKAPKMVLLELKGCGVMSEAFIDCPLLTSLDASFCSQLQDYCFSATAASCCLIESLILMSCQSIGADGLSSLHSLKHLTFLDLSYTFLVDLQPVFDSCLQLKVMKLQACKYLHDKSLEPLYKDRALPALRELDLSYTTLCQSALEELLALCTHLTHVSLNGCVKIDDLSWGFPTVLDHEPFHLPRRLLQNLNCVGCPIIKKVYIPPKAHCEYLTYLNLSLSVKLKEVNIACCNLSYLNLSNCSSLEILKLECPRLTSLHLQSCNVDEQAVEYAILNCNMLETLDLRFCPKIHSVSMGSLRASCPSLKRIFS